MTTEDPVQAQLILIRRNQILDAATDVFAEKGFHRATIRDVAKAAGIADGTIYNYFENKAGLLLGILDRLNETPEREEHFAGAMEGDLREWVRGYVRYRFAALGEEGLRVFQALLPEVLVNAEVREAYLKQVLLPTYEIAEQYFGRLYEETGQGKREVALSLRVISGMFLGVLVLRIMGDPALIDRWDEVAEVMADLILNGIGTGGKDSDA